MPFRRSLLTPLSVPAPRALIEALVGYTLLAGVGAAVYPRQVASRLTPLVVFTVLAAAWLVLWPAWRLRRVPHNGEWGLDHWWVRLPAALARLGLLSLGLGFAAIGITALVYQTVGNPTAISGAGAAGVVFAVTFSLILGRAAILIAAAVRRRVKRRLRWQLMAANIVVVVLTLTTMTGVGSILAIQLILYGTQPNAAQMAGSIARTIELAAPRDSLDASTAQRVLTDIQSQTVPVGGEPPLAGLAPHALLPDRIALLRLDGAPIAGSQGRFVQPTARQWATALIRNHPTLWRRARGDALARRTAIYSVSVQTDTSSSRLVVSEAPVTLHGRLVAVVLAQVTTLSLTATRLWQGTLALFGVSTVALILVTSIPVLVISFLASYILARGLTRKLEDVSAVTTAIASGDLSRRAPEGSSGEVGRLADDVNRMAAHLETSVGELQAARTAAIDALTSRRELVAGISHELRTPLAVLRAHLEGLLAPHPVSVPNGADTTHADLSVPVATLESLQHETERLSSLIDDLFELSRVETGAVEVRREPVDVAAIVDEVVASMGPLARQEGGITLKADIRPGLPAATADPDRLHQVLSNLVRNAVRHTPDGGIIVIGVAHEADWLSISVADTGEGIPVEHLPRVFERFYRVENSRSRESGGAGLGLAIVAEFVELMGGRISVVSQAGEGSCFKISLPVAHEEERAAPGQTVPA